MVPTVTSDHHALCLQMKARDKQVISSAAQPLRIEPWWMEHEDCNKLVEENWSFGHSNHPIHTLSLLERSRFNYTAGAGKHSFHFPKKFRRSRRL